MAVTTPNWVKDAVFYQIFPDRFAKGQQSIIGFWRANNLEPWDGKPTTQGYKGGDLWGIIDRLDYLQDLGITALYLTPIFQSTCNHRYHTCDYYQVDPMLGGNRALEELINALHKRKMKLVLDGVFNHVGRGFFYFNDILENGPHSPWLDWFTLFDWPVSAYDGSKNSNYLGWANNRALPQLNHANPQVREYIMQVAEYWLKKGIDGWRLDVPFEIKVFGFWQEFRDRVKAINPEAYIVGEVWQDARNWLDGKQFDAVMNYLFAVPTIAFTAGDRVLREFTNQHDFAPYPALSAEGYAGKIQTLLSLYDWQIQLAQYNLLDSHDTARLLTVVGDDRKSVELATILLFTFPGSPSIFYGDEVGLAGGIDPDCRRVFPNEKYWDLETLNIHKQLIALRHKYTALRTGEYRVIYAEGDVYIFCRTSGKQKIIVAINVGMDGSQIEVSIEDLKNRSIECLYGEGKLERIGGKDKKHFSFNLPHRSGSIFA